MLFEIFNLHFCSKLNNNVKKNQSLRTKGLLDNMNFFTFKRAESVANTLIADEAKQGAEHMLCREVCPSATGAWGFLAFWVLF